MSTLPKGTGAFARFVCGAVAFCFLLGITGGLSATEYDRQATIVESALKLQGVWDLKSKEVGGETEPRKTSEGTIDIVLSIQGTRFEQTQYLRSTTVDALPQCVDGGKFKLVLAPKNAIDFLSSVTRSEGKDQEQHGIYTLDGDRLIICVSPYGVKERPKTFSTRGTKNTVYVFVKRSANKLK